MTIHHAPRRKTSPHGTIARRGLSAVAVLSGLMLAMPSVASADIGDCSVPDPAQVSDAQAEALYVCITDTLRAQLATLEAGGTIEGLSWLLSDRPEARAFLEWDSVTRAPYTSATHGGRYVVNLAAPNAIETYRQFEDGVPMPVGGLLAKPSFTISDTGTAQLGPLFLMERAEDGAFPEMGDWIYSAVMPTGSVLGPTGGPNNGAVQFCADCHMAIGADTDSMTYLPEEYRVSE